MGHTQWISQLLWKWLFFEVNMFGPYQDLYIMYYYGYYTECLCEGFFKRFPIGLLQPMLVMMSTLCG